MKLRHFLPAICWGLLIVVMYVLPGEDIPVDSVWQYLGFDKVMHIAMFALWVPMTMVAISKQQIALGHRMGVGAWAFMIGVVVGLILELGQERVVPGRMTDLWDGLANITGSLLGLLIYRVVYGKS